MTPALLHTTPLRGVRAADNFPTRCAYLAENFSTTRPSGCAPSLRGPFKSTRARGKTTGPPTTPTETPMDENTTHCHSCHRDIPALSEFYGGGRDLTAHQPDCPELAEALADLRNR